MSAVLDPLIIQCEILYVIFICNSYDTYPSMALQLFVGPWLLFSFLILYTVGRTP
jgi:hypothetical protein